MRFAILAAALLGFPIAVAAAGCAAPPARSPAPPPYQYRVGPGDILSVQVFRERDLQQVVTVDPGGRIAVPLAGSLLVRDRTLPEIADAVAAELRRTDALVEPRVTVQLQESHSSQVQVLGEVARQRPIGYRDGLGLIAAIAEVGGPTWATAKLEAVHIVRGALDRPVLVAIDVEDVLDGETPDVRLRPGDIVVVPAKWVTVFDRYVTQALAPFRAIFGSAASAASAPAAVAP